MTPQDKAYQSLPLITVVTVVYNSESTIEKTIKSVISQTYSRIEYIIIDGKSTDHTLEIARKYEDYLSLIISEPDKGIYDAMNKALLYATGEWVCFMNSGDCFHNQKVLEDLYQNRSFADNVGVIYGDTCLYDGESFLSMYKNAPFWKALFPYRRGLGVCHQSMFVRTEIAKQIKFDLRYKISADFDMFYKINKLHFIFEYAPIIIADYDMNGLSSSIGWREIYREAAQIMNCKFNIFYNLFYAYCWIKEKVLKE